MIYSLRSASGKELNIEWGNFTKKEYFEEGSSVYSLEQISEYFNKETKTYDGNKYVYGYSGKSPEEIYNKAKKNFESFGRVMRNLTETSFQLGEYVYTIEINSLEELNRLIREFDRVVIDEDSIIIYDDYLE